MYLYGIYYLDLQPATKSVFKHIHNYTIDIEHIIYITYLVWSFVVLWLLWSLPVVQSL
jgi:hypothetical protein